MSPRLHRPARLGALASASLVLLLAAAPAHAAEVCGDGQDNDSNGITDEGCYPYGVTGVCESTLSCDLAAVAPSTGSLVVPLPADYDVHVPYGPSLQLRRTYFSKYEPGGGAHGYRTSMGRWNHNYMSWLDEHSGDNTAVVHTQTGQDVLFSKSGAPAGGYQYYVAQAGAHVDYLRQATTSPYAWELRSLTGEVAVYDSAGKLTELRDALATPNVVALTYDGSGYLSTVTDAADTRRFVFTYTSNKLTKVSLQKKASGTFSEDTYVTYGYTSGELTSVAFAGTTAHTNTYSGGYLTRIDDAAGKQYLQFAYSAATAGQVVRVHSSVGVLGREYNSAHASCSGETQQFFERANTTSCDDDADCGSGNRCGGETNPAAANTGVCFRASTCLTAASTIEDLVATIDPIAPCDGACAPVAAYSWDTGSGNAKLELAGVQDGEGAWRSFDYNADGQVTLSAHGDSDADPSNASSGALTWYFYDTAFPGRLTERRSLSVLKPAGTCSASVSTDCARTLQTWNSDGLLTAIEQRGFTLVGSGTVDDYAYTETRAYDALGRLTSTDGPLPGSDDETTFSYHSSGTYDRDMLETVAVETSAGSFQSTTFSSYDIWGKPGQFKLPGSIYSCRDYDNHRGWVVSKRQAMDTNTCSTTHASDLSVAFEYDSWGRRTKETRPEGNCVHSTYDSSGRLTSTKRRDDCNAGSTGDTVSYTYDDDSNLTYTHYKNDADVGKYEARHTYYASGRIQRRVNAANASFGKDFSYLEDGSLFSIEGENGVGLTEWTRDALARATKIYRYNDATDDEVTELSYPSGTRAALPVSVEDDLSDVSERVRDDLGRVVKVVSKAGETTIFERDEGGRVVTRLDPGGVQNWFTYDSLGRLLTVDLRHETCATGSSVYETSSRTTPRRAHVPPGGRVAMSAATSRTCARASCATRPRATRASTWRPTMATTARGG
jgi:YD repeat-containing protein